MNTGRDNQLWLQCWRDRSIDFHQASVNPLLARLWPDLHLACGSRIFVPLCGKSLDMIWLAEQGHHVIGVELSPIAVSAFFRENALQVRQQRRGAFTLWRSKHISIYCGDYFSLRAHDIGAIDTVYDRAALTALPVPLRVPYLAKLNQITGGRSNIFLLTIEDADADATLDEALAVDAEVTQLYAGNFSIDLTFAESVLEPDPAGSAGGTVRAEYKAYRLRNHLRTEPEAGARPEKYGGGLLAVDNQMQPDGGGITHADRPAPAQMRQERILPTREAHQCHAGGGTDRQQRAADTGGQRDQ